MSERMTPVKSKCKKCSKIDKFEVPSSGIAARSKGGTLKKAFPTLSDARLKQLEASICPTCQAK